jgi:hypothetical protein
MALLTAMFLFVMIAVMKGSNHGDMAMLAMPLAVINNTCLGTKFQTGW